VGAELLGGDHADVATGGIVRGQHCVGGGRHCTALARWGRRWERDVGVGGGAGEEDWRERGGSDLMVEGGVGKGAYPSQSSAVPFLAVDGLSVFLRLKFRGDALSPCCFMG
jgi:hypothetical protein